MKLLITGFEPFGDNKTNPTMWLAENSGENYSILPVTYTGVQQFISQLDSSTFDAWLMLGLSAKAEKFNIELIAKNYDGSTPDNTNQSGGNSPINPNNPANLASTLWNHPLLNTETNNWETSVSAGDYLCNHLLYQGLTHFPDKRIGFLHVPQESIIALEEQLSNLKEIIQLIKE